MGLGKEWGSLRPCITFMCIYVYVHAHACIYYLQVHVCTVCIHATSSYLCAEAQRRSSLLFQGRGASQSVVRTSSKLSRGSRGSRGRSPSKGLQGTGRAESKSSRGSRGADSDGRSDAREDGTRDSETSSRVLGSARDG